MKRTWHIVDPKGRRILLAAGWGLCVLGCVEEVPIEIDGEVAFQVQQTLVVEATLTDELRTQRVELSRAVEFSNDSIVGFDEEDPNTYLVPDLNPENRPILWETGARVVIEDGSGQRHQFTEGKPGRYFSDSPFAARPGTTYILRITLKNGETVLSEAASLVGSGALTGLRAARIVDPLRGEGLAFYVNTSASTAGPAYFRYTFEETFKVVAPYWSPKDFVLNYYDPCPDPVEYDLQIEYRTEEQQVCYRTEPSRSVVQATTEGLASGDIRDFPVHFIPAADYRIGERFSLLVRQHSEDHSAYLFYNRLRQFSQEGNVFAQVQPGFLEGNLHAEAGGSLQVLGYFSVASVAEQRIFLDYSDYFPGEPQPPWVVPCQLLSSPESHLSHCVIFDPGPDGENIEGLGCPLSIIEAVDLGRVISYYGEYTLFGGQTIADCPGPHVYVARVCGDCTVIGTNMKPDFWIE